MVNAAHHKAVMMKLARVQAAVFHPNAEGPAKINAIQAINGMVEPTYPHP